MKCNGCHAEFWGKRSLASHRGHALRFNRIVIAKYPDIYANWFLIHVKGDKVWAEIANINGDLSRMTHSIYRLIRDESNETKSL